MKTLRNRRNRNTPCRQGPKTGSHKKTLEDALQSINSHVVTPTEHRATLRNVVLALVLQCKK